jgi:hypothetical protein
MKYVRWVSFDVEYVGVVIKETNETIVLQTSFGLVSVPTNDGTFTEISEEEFKQHSQPLPVVKEDVVVKQQVKHVNTERKERTGTKTEKAREIFKQNPDKTRKEIIQMFVELLDMTEAGAATFYNNTKNHFS